MTVDVGRETVVETASPEETIAVGRALGEAYPNGALFYIEGDLGAGKTVLTKGIAAAYGVAPERVASPTFALVHRYGEGRLPVYHVDLYRIESEDELDELGLDEMEGEDAAVVVEWPDRLGSWARRDAIRVHIEILDDERRRIRWSAPAARGVAAPAARGGPS